MKVIAFNGSPRKNWNTATLLDHALKGAASQGADTGLIHLYDYNYKGCISCFACKLKGGKSYGRCAVDDDLKPILEKVEETDAIILGSPIYFGVTTGGMRSFLERLMFQYLVYDANYSSLFKRRIPTGFIYTMNVNQRRLEEMAYQQNLKGTEMAMKRTFGASEALFVTDTYQFDDYSKYETSAFNVEEKAKRRKEVFPVDCQKAFEMGVKFACQSIS
ncbi:2-amino-4-deoxychorismate dehydrogenase [Pelotomaculum sp. FP]|uniref:flavodoxin family protein n=1 Tax=Pelotomaculum sp. FP TaxID=261474 RepID=UPI001066AEB1|nr:flavodoxin family protein [Pelotomaculum sp. FP]TEB15634.1 2-amino-4-deoxychorismate dehydrogenase [Pelotomaculum sp. FP]